MFDSIEPEWLWLIGGVLLLILEVMAPGVFLVFIGAAAIATGVFTLLFDLGAASQLALFALYAVIAVMVGQGIKVINEDPTNHNIHGFPKINQQFNFSQAQKGMEKVVNLGKAEDFKIKCDVHNWMGAHAFVMTHPFFAISDEEGNYEIKNVPPGTYDIKIWHETLAPKGIVKKGVKVEAGKAAQVDEKLKAAKK